MYLFFLLPLVQRVFTQLAILIYNFLSRITTANRSWTYTRPVIYRIYTVFFVAIQWSNGVLAFGKDVDMASSCFSTPQSAFLGKRLGSPATGHWLSVLDLFSLSSSIPEIESVKTEIRNKENKLLSSIYLRT